LESSFFTLRGFKRRNECCRAEIVTRRCAEINVVHSTQSCPSLTGNWERKHQRK